MDLDAKICYCFHQSKRKLLNFMRQEKPRVPSQLSECGGAGTGCGWCIPFLKQLFVAAQKGDGSTFETIDAEEYSRQRAEYIDAGKGKPPPGADK